MAQEKQVEVSVALAQGDFSFSLNGVLLHIRVRDSEGVQGAASYPEIRQALPGVEAAGNRSPAQAVPESGEAARLAEEASYYRQISQEIYEGLGQLAKQINLSIQDLSLAEIIQSGTPSPGEHLEQVRSQVTDVLEMTEKATLNILNLVESIQEDCRKMQGHFLNLANGDGQRDQAEGHSAEAPDPAEIWSRLLAQGEAFDRQIRMFISGASFPGNALPLIRLPDVLQVLLEFCQTEKVKPHLKSLKDRYETLFQTSDAEQALARLAAETPPADGLYQLPVDQTLAILQETCTDGRVQDLLTKLLASAAKIFPTATFPLEGLPSAGSGPAGPEEDMLSLWQGLYESLQQAAQSPSHGNCGAISAADERLQEAARKALDTVKGIHTSLSRITEALAFQDLSGQRLLKVLRILRQLQVQVLTLLVAAGSKLRVRLAGKELAFTEGEISAQQQLNRMLHTLADGPQNPEDAAHAPEERPLDQEAINELLTSMGF